MNGRITYYFCYIQEFRIWYNKYIIRFKWGGFIHLPLSLLTILIMIIRPQSNILILLIRYANDEYHCLSLNQFFSRFRNLQVIFVNIFLYLIMTQRICFSELYNVYIIFLLCCCKLKIGTKEKIARSIAAFLMKNFKCISKFYFFLRIYVPRFNVILTTLHIWTDDNLLSHVWEINTHDSIVTEAGFKVCDIIQCTTDEK